VTYPLGWTVTFPEKSLTLHIKAKVQNQEMIQNRLKLTFT